MSISRDPGIIHFQSQNPGMHMIWDKWTLYRKCLLLEHLKRNYDDLCTPARNPVTSYNIILLCDPLLYGAQCKSSILYKLQKVLLNANWKG